MAIPREAKLGHRGDPEFCSLAAGPSGSRRSAGCCSGSPREAAAGGPGVGVPSCGSCKALPGPAVPATPGGTQLRAGWARGGPSRCAPPLARPESAQRARASVLCIKPSSLAKVEEVGLPPGWEAGGRPAPVVFRQRQWVRARGAGCALPAPAERSGERITLGAPRSSQPRHRTHPKHPSRALWKVEPLCPSEDLGRALGTLGAGAPRGAHSARADPRRLRGPCPLVVRDGRAGARAPGAPLPRGAAGPLDRRR